MKVYYSEPLCRLTAKIVDKLYPQLNQYNIGVFPLFASSTQTWGTIRKANAVEKTLASLADYLPTGNKIDFIILINATELFENAKWREKLLYILDHELAHIQIETDKKKGQTLITLRKHDLEDFYAVLSRWEGLIVDKDQSFEKEAFLEEVKEELDLLEAEKPLILSELQ